MSEARTARRRVDLNADDYDLLTKAAAIFGLNQSETVRRLLRGALEVAPALTADNSQKMIEASHQLRMIGRNLAQVLRAVHDGRVVGLEETEAVWAGLHERVKALDEHIVSITRSHGLKLRRASKLEEVAG